MNIREMIEQRERETLSEFAVLSSQTKGRRFSLEKCPLRTEFQRDRDRIIHCKAFRRLKHKTQVFIAPRGDHYRTRLTHTLEVSQIARTIARSLCLNEDLTEAMSLGHDLGHTPFGHKGEEALNEICEDGFKHYKQSLRVVDVLEGGEGLNLTFEVRDGIVNHTGSCMPETLEGKILKYADKFAYINHDIDDAIRAGMFTEEDLPKKAIDVLGNRHSVRINTLINDIIKCSKGINDIRMSDEVYGAMYELRNFMFENVYRSSEKKSEEDKGCYIIREMYNYFIKNTDKLPEEYRKFLNEYSVSQVVCDYIAGMSDPYAIAVFNEIFVPKAWQL